MKKLHFVVPATTINHLNHYYVYDRIVHLGHKNRQLMGIVYFVQFRYVFSLKEPL